MDTRITIEQKEGRIGLLNQGGTEVACLYMGDKELTYDKLADTAEVLGYVDWEAEIAKADLTPMNVTMIALMPERGL